MASPGMSVELEDSGTVIDGLRDITHEASHGGRFPDFQAQIGGFVLNPEGQLVYLRWAPTKSQGRGYHNAWNPLTQELTFGAGPIRGAPAPGPFHVPERSRPFLQVALETSIRQQQPMNVMLLVGSVRYDVGTFLAVDYRPTRGR